MGRFWIKGLKILLFVVVVLLISGVVVMGLWNRLMPAIFGVATIDFRQALGLLILSRILFGGLRGGPHAVGRRRFQMMRRWEKMTPEEREKFREGLRHGC